LSAIAGRNKEIQSKIDVLGHNWSNRGAAKLTHWSGDKSVAEWLVPYLFVFSPNCDVPGETVGCCKYIPNEARSLRSWISTLAVSRISACEETLNESVCEIVSSGNGHRLQESRSFIFLESGVVGNARQRLRGGDTL
jgi:hypothetical protein